MTLAPIPDFPVDEPKAKAAQPSAATVPDDQPDEPPSRQPHTPIEVRGNAIVLTFMVIPGTSGHFAGEHDHPHSCSAGAVILLKPDRLPSDDESTETGPVMLVRQLAERHTTYRCIIDEAFRLKAMADELLADLGA